MPRPPKVNHSGTRANHSGTRSSGREHQSVAPYVIGATGGARSGGGGTTALTECSRQLPLPLADATETQTERLRRVLAGVPLVTTAAVYFTEQAYREATARAQAEAVGPSSPRSDVGPIGRAKDLTRLDR